MRVIVAILLAMTLAAPAMAGDFEEGLQAYDAQNYPTAYMRWLSAAVHGNPAAQYNLALLCLDGKGVERNYVHALAWLNMAAASLPAGDKRNEVFKLRDQVSANLTPDEIKRSTELWRQWEKEHKQVREQSAKEKGSGVAATSGGKEPIKVQSMPTPEKAEPLPGQKTMPDPATDKNRPPKAK